MRWNRSGSCGQLAWGVVYRLWCEAATVMRQLNECCMRNVTHPHSPWIGIRRASSFGFLLSSSTSSNPSSRPCVACAGKGGQRAVVREVKVHTVDEKSCSNAVACASVQQR